MMLGKAIKENQTIIVEKRGVNKDIINALHYYMPYAVRQNCARANLFKGKDNKETAKNIWNFLKSNIQYIEDSVHFQDIKLPNRLVKEKKGDCKSFSMFAGSALKCLGIPCKLVYTSYTDSKVPQHVYVMTNEGIIIDAVWNKFNSEKPYTYKYYKSI